MPVEKIETELLAWPADATANLISQRLISKTDDFGNTAIRRWSIPSAGGPEGRMDREIISGDFTDAQNRLYPLMSFFGLFSIAFPIFAVSECQQDSKRLESIWGFQELCAVGGFSRN